MRYRTDRKKFKIGTPQLIKADIETILKASGFRDEKMKK